MYNLLVSANDKSWGTSPFKFERTRIFEYTDTEIAAKYSSLDELGISELCSFPTLFMIEGERIPTKIGRITEIIAYPNEVKIKFEFSDIEPLPTGKINWLRYQLDIQNDFELNRTHWAVKDVDLLEVLLGDNLISRDEINKCFPPKPLPKLDTKITIEKMYNKSQIFLVHGHDDSTLLIVKGYVESLGFEPIILQSQPSSGRTVIEKLEEYTNVGFGIVLYTECDIGAKRGTIEFSFRARQNVIFEHGYLIGKLERKRVVALTSGTIEHPSDVSGIVYIPIDDKNSWKEKLKQELESAGYF